MNTRIFNTSEVTVEILNNCAQDLKNGAVVVLPTETVYGIVCNASDEDAVGKLCDIKQKPKNVPLQYLAVDTPAAAALSVMTEADKKLAAAFWPGELTLILPPQNKAKIF
ncbi:tRNA threonylcarbamoyl adenosine modification protein (Sua5/YciO/YrdC/YwlC family) [Elusimicrobium posterum]|uniref:L-threonylcarbamoyladenylate synthase n=1 Tax=Elusimicrobium posterum TaxID=3116653 RepID=UPI003C743714